MDSFLFDLAPGWALGADDLQWIVLRRRNFRTQRGWKPVAYVATKKSYLLRVLADRDIEVNAFSQANLDCLPDTFLKWRSLNLVEIAR